MTNEPRAYTAGGDAMNARQRALARRALGLPNGNRRSHRNRFVAAYAPGPYDDWQAMVDAGWAGSSGVVTAVGVRFWLTPVGARMALGPDETLCPEDFPER